MARRMSSGTVVRRAALPADVYSRKSFEAADQLARLVPRYGMLARKVSRRMAAGRLWGSVAGSYRGEGGIGIWERRKGRLGCCANSSNTAIAQLQCSKFFLAALTVRKSDAAPRQLRFGLMA